MKYVYLLILCSLMAMIISFRNYKKETYKEFTAKQAPLRLLYGFAMVLITLSQKIFKSKSDLSKDKLINLLKSLSFGICSFIIIIFFGLMYSFTSGSHTASDDNSYKSTLSIENKSDFNILDVNNQTYVDKEAQSTDSSFADNEEHIKIKNTISIFEDYREDIEKAFLNENESYLSITKPLNLISAIGKENIIIAWSFEDSNVIDENGNIIYENVGSDGLSTLAYASLTLNDVTATLTIPIFISSP